ncbi:right-handed parallel beta-helix repeat-containing protein, partial [candidate division KSB1 bacterium]
AIDAMAYRGGGTVHVLPGEYTLYNSIYLRSNVTIIGDREKTILKRGPVISSRLLIDADVGQMEITPKDVSLFKVGMGISLRSNSLMNAMTSTPLTIKRIEHGVLYVNDYIVHDYTADLDSWGKGGHDGLVSNVFPMIFGHRVENVVVDGFTVDSKTDTENPGWKSVRLGSVYFRTVKNSVIRNVKSINAQGDGILVARASKNIIVEDCESAYNTFHGMHPGSHATHVTVRRCHFHHNGSDGLYICWGVKNSKFLDNVIHHNGTRKNGKRNGISIGHKDTDNIIAGNHIYENAVSGLHFRKKTDANGAHRNIIKDNIIENNGLKGHVPRGYGIFISGITHDLTFQNNTIRETRSGKEALQFNAFYLSPEVSRVKMLDNKISGHPKKAVVDKSGNSDNILQ